MFPPSSTHLFLYILKIQMRKKVNLVEPINVLVTVLLDSEAKSSGNTDQSVFPGAFVACQHTGETNSPAKAFLKNV